MTFAICVALLLTHYMPKYKVTIDIEYLGHDGIIHKWILARFGFIGQSSRADSFCREVVAKKYKPDKIIKYEDIGMLLEEFKKAGSQKSGQRST